MTTTSIRRLGPGDEEILAMLAADDADFDLDDRGGARPALAPDDAAAYLADPHVLHWIAERDGVVVGHMYCHVLRKRAAPAREVLLYEIGVRAAHRRSGVGRALIAALDEWMRANEIGESWVLADNDGAAAFYRECRFHDEDEPPQYLVRP